jgi:hypothetical protein
MALGLQSRAEGGFMARARFLLVPFVFGAAALGACNNSPDAIETPMRVAAAAPRAITGGTLTITRDGASAIAADSERDRVWIVDLASLAVTHEVKLNPGDEPGRIVEDAHGRAHVALRAGGAIATIDLASGAVVDRTSVCASPRGVAYDSKRDAVHVACMQGQIITLPAAGGAPTHRINVDRDLRDIDVEDDGSLSVTTFRSANLLRVDLETGVTNRSLPGVFTDFSQRAFSPTVAWRTIRTARGHVMTHQRSLDSVLAVSQATPDAYGGTGANGGCSDGVVHSTTTFFDANGTPSIAGVALPSTVLPVDVASFDSANSFLPTIAVAGAGSDTVFIADQGNLSLDAQQGGGCAVGTAVHVFDQPIAVAFAPNGDLFVQTRDKAGIRRFQADAGFALAGSLDLVAYDGAGDVIDMSDSGHDLFHKVPTGNNGLGTIACASCHPEGREDGHVWNFDSGARRTQFIGNHVLDTTPLHWSGDMASMDAIMDAVFVGRMGGTHQGPRHIKALSRFIQELPALPPLGADPAAAARGDKLFHDGFVGCASCHSGEKLTNNQTVDVGTGEAFQVPTLVGVSMRTPLMHNGCADTLLARFGDCGGGEKHGHTAQLSADQLADLVAYLETL